MTKKLYDGKTILITGGTGSFGKEFAYFLLEKCNPKKVIIFSRDEYKQFYLAQEFSKYSNIRFFIGDVRDLSRLRIAFHGVDFVVHAAALKQIPALEYNPTEAIATNIQGTQNVITAALEAQVKKVLFISTDKAAQPVNLYGATKMAAEKLITASNSYAGERPTRFAAVRYGNVLNSRGSVVETILNDSSTKALPVTDSRMTRFWITLQQAHELVTFALSNMVGGEIFIPKAPSMSIPELFKALAPDRATRTIGIRPGEKIHEVLITPEEMRNTRDTGKYFVILPTHEGPLSRRHTRYKKKPSKTILQKGVYSSDTNTQWLNETQLRKLLGLK